MKIWRNMAIAGLIALDVISCQTRSGSQNAALQNDMLATPQSRPNAETSQAEFDDGLVKPWNDENRAFVLDGRDYNEIKWDETAKDKRVAGMIFRASGPEHSRCLNTDKVVADSKYDKKRDEAKKRGYLWGSYHMGVSKAIMNPEEQAQFYLDTAKPADDEVMALDLESFSTVPEDACFMKMDEAIRFINYIKTATGRYPIVYVTGSILEEIVKKEPEDGSGIFAKTPLWFARFENNIQGCFNVPQRNWWKTYDLWQFASERNCGVPPKRKSLAFCELPIRGQRTPCPFEQRPPDKVVPWVPGVKNDMDINIYNGTKEELKKAWLVNFNR